MFTHHHNNLTACKSCLYFYSTIVIIDLQKCIHLQSYWQSKKMAKIASTFLYILQQVVYSVLLYLNYTKKV